MQDISVGALEAVVEMRRLVVEDARRCRVAASRARVSVKSFGFRARAAVHDGKGPAVRAHFAELLDRTVRGSAVALEFVS